MTTRSTRSGSKSPMPSSGETLQQILAECGMSRVDLASHLGLPLECVSAMIAGEEPISAKVALQLAQLFDRSARFFQR